jgi:hypothetical protein
MKWNFRISLALFLAMAFQIPRAAAFDWDPVTDAEKGMKSNPLDPGAGALVLFKRGEIDVLERQSLFWTTRITTYARIKILNDAGREAANISLEAPKYMRLSKIEGRTILPSGQIIPLDPSQVFRGRAYEAGKTFAIIKTSFTLPNVEPGAIIEYQAEEMVDWFFPPPWIFDTNELATLESSLKVIVGPRLGMSLFPMDTPLSRLSSSQKTTAQGEEFDFAVRNLRPIRREPFSVPFRDQATTVLFTPSELSFQDQVYPIIKKWDDVAAEVLHQFDEMSKHNKQVRDKAKELAAKISNDRGRAETIYKFIQQNVTSSELLGVFMGRSADDVLTGKRGDPDEINSMFVMMLKELKIDADIVLVAAQNWQSLTPQFPNMSEFSRVVTLVNLKEGAIFADPASPSAPFGELPWFEKGITGLAIKGKKIEQVSIPAGKPEDNLSVTKATFQLSHDWKAEGDVSIQVTGAEAIDFRGDLTEEAPAKMEQRLADYFAFGHSDAIVSNIAHPDLQDSSQPFLLKAHLQEKLANEAGPGEVLLNPWLDDQYQTPLFKATERHSAVRFYNPEKRVSTTTWQLPEGIKIEQLPKEVNLANDLGDFSHSCTQKGSTVSCTRTFVLKKMLLKTTLEYANARKFFDEIAKNDQEVILLREQ